MVAPRTPSVKFPVLGSDQAAVPHVCTSDKQDHGSRDDTVRLHLGSESGQAFPRESLRGTTHQQLHATSNVVPKDCQVTKSHPPQGTSLKFFRNPVEVSLQYSLDVKAVASFHVSLRQALTFTSAVLFQGNNRSF